MAYIKSIKEPDNKHMALGVLTEASGPEIEPDHGILTTRIMFKAASGYHQGFGNICLDKKSGPDFVEELCHTFGVTHIRNIVGKRCFALYSFGRYNDPIDGLLSVDTGKKFVIDTWRRKHWPTKVSKNKLVDEQERIRGQIAHFEQRIQEYKQELKRLPETFYNWEE